MHNYFREGGMRWTTRGLEQQLFQENEWFGFSRTRGSPNFMAGWRNLSATHPLKPQKTN